MVDIIGLNKQYIPQVNFSELNNLSQEEIERIRRRGSLVIKDVVDDAQAIAWKASLKEFINANPDVEGNSVFSLIISIIWIFTRRSCGR